MRIPAHVIAAEKKPAALKYLKAYMACLAQLRE
jgi:hypothetical protein